MIAAVALAMMMAAPQTANAARPTGAERIGMSTDAVLELHRFGRCVVDRDPRTATVVLRQDFTTARYQRGLRSLLDSNRPCVPRGQQARFSGVLGAGVVAEALLERDGGAMLAALPDRAATVSDTGFSASDTAAICVVKHDIADVRALLASTPMGAEEASAVSGLSTALSQCLSKGQDFRFNRPGLRAILALASFRIVAGTSPANRG